MTTANWHLPAIEAQNLLQNILCYLAPPPICGTPLPIELLSFSGNSLDDANILEWTTSTELDNDYFIVERSSNGSDFEEIQKVDGAGNSNSAISYSIRDNDPLNGINYYRLKQTDFSGNYKHSSIIALKGTDLVVFILTQPMKRSLLHSKSTRLKELVSRFEIRLDSCKQWNW